MGVKSVTRIGNGTLFQVKHYSGSEYETSAEAAAGKIIEEVGPLLDDTSAGLAYLSESLERASKTDIGGLTQWDLMGVLGLIRGLQTRTTAVQLDLLVAMAVLETFEESEDHTKSHGNNHRL
jgi:hypothetical protein